MIGQPRHIINDKSSFIDLLFTTNRKLLCDVGVKQTNCHCNIVYGSLNLSMPFPPPLLQGRLGLQEHGSGMYTGYQSRL